LSHQKCHSDACHGQLTEHETKTWLRNYGDVLVVMLHTVDGDTVRQKHDYSVLGREAFRTDSKGYVMMTDVEETAVLRRPKAYKTRVTAPMLTSQRKVAGAMEGWKHRWAGWRLDSDNKKPGQLTYVLCQQFDVDSMLHPLTPRRETRPTEFELVAVVDKDLGEPFDKSILPQGDYSRSKVHYMRNRHEYLLHLIKNVDFAEGRRQMWYTFKEDVVQMRSARDGFNERVASTLQEPQMLVFRLKES
jgi:hypothetical protein